jgi:hypothetical protein
MPLLLRSRTLWVVPAQAVERGAPLGEGGGELDVLVLEDEEVVGFGRCVEDDIM